MNWGEGTKRLQHPVLGPIEMEYSSFAVDGRPDLSMIVYNPVDPAVVARIRELIQPQPAQAGGRQRASRKRLVTKPPAIDTHPSV